MSNIMRFKGYAGRVEYSGDVVHVRPGKVVKSSR
jgi:hypothetical protein